jgi:hypothetical protein
LAGGTVVRKYFAIARALANGYFWRNASDCRPTVKGGPGPWKVPAGEIAAFKLLKPNFDLAPPASIVAECARQSLVDPFCAPSFDPELFDHESLVLLVHLSSITYFTNFSK